VFETPVLDPTWFNQGSEYWILSALAIAKWAKLPELSENV